MCVAQSEEVGLKVKYIHHMKMECTIINTKHTENTKIHILLSYLTDFYHRKNTTKWCKLQNRKNRNKIINYKF